MKIQLMNDAIYDIMEKIVNCIEKIILKTSLNISEQSGKILTNKVKKAL